MQSLHSFTPYILKLNYTGNIPLRNLVYRVQDLPPSMRPLVYDFGQLNSDQEESYIKHIVSDHVRNKTIDDVYATHIIL